MRCKRLSIAVFVAVIAPLMTACAPTRYAIADREPVQATAPVELPAWPDGELIVCPRGDWDPEARCPSGSEWIAYDSDAADTLHAYAIAGEANTEIAALQADQLGALNTEADALNRNAEELERELRWADHGRLMERFGWILGVGALIAIGL